jgi:hypothetical protein
MLTDSHKALLVMQANLDQMAACIRQGLDDPQCVGQPRELAEKLRRLTEQLRATVQIALDELDT